jgi:beta-glucanase (GH16 family)
MTRRLLGKVINDDGVQLWNPGARSRFATSKLVDSKGVDPTQWHRYRLDWSLKRVSFEVDDVQVFESALSPNPPLGLVIWIDNQYAAFTPEGKIAMGVLEGKEEWLEIKDLEIK